MRNYIVKTSTLKSEELIHHRFSSLLLSLQRELWSLYRFCRTKKTCKIMFSNHCFKSLVDAVYIRFEWVMQLIPDEERTLQCSRYYKYIVFLVTL